MQDEPYREKETALTYTYRERAGESVRVQVTPDGILYRNSIKGDVELPYAQIKELGLYSPMPGAYVCRIKARSGKKYLLCNRSFADGVFQSQDNSYIKFVRELHRLASRHPEIRYRAGQRVTYYIAIVSLVVLGSLLAGLLGLIAWAVLSGRASRLGRSGIAPFFSIGTLGILVPILFYWIRKNGAGSYRPLEIPDNLLPG